MLRVHQFSAPSQASESPPKTHEMICRHCSSAPRGVAETIGQAPGIRSGCMSCSMGAAAGIVLQWFIKCLLLFSLNDLLK